MSQEHGSRAGLPWLWGPQTCTELPSPALCALSCIVLPRVPAGEARGSAGGLLGAAADGCALGRGGEAGSACAGSGLCCSADPCLQLWLCPRSTIMELREPEARHRGLRGACVQAGGSDPCLHVGPHCQRRAETPGSTALPSSPRPRGAAARCRAGLWQPSPMASALFFSWLGRCGAGGEAVTQAGSNEMSYKNDFINRRFL